MLNPILYLASASRLIDKSEENKKQNLQIHLRAQRSSAKVPLHLLFGLQIGGAIEMRSHMVERGVEDVNLMGV